MNTAKLLLAPAFACAPVATTVADEFSSADLERWEQQFQSVVQKGRALWTDGKLGTNGVACAQCHPNAANTHPETYPKFQKQLGKVADLWEMINWCLRNPLEGEPMAADDPRMVAMLSYATWERGRARSRQAPIAA
jgi:cytochrome c